ncbi:uncharacterized protein DFE_0588 [Desulfovibrio ferrophilus]|uniref:DUF362 domain-containing protein n=2 Tax=Desulfovibrio ferrophilus TaxID=241368 RepID=A0A2Z6AVP7_9BACT|nr:uncharacterized protein DFE_0588 [Desulfovibrio ferrophilus]
MQGVVSVGFESYATSVPRVLDACGAHKVLAEQQRVLIKPNLVNASPPPVTTPVECVEAVIDYVRAHSDAEIVVAEGCGDACRETPEIFAALGYVGMADRMGAVLLDLNTAPLVERQNPACELFPQMWLPAVAFTHFIISIPMLKAHSLAGMTGTIKNMMGFPPPEHYAGQHGSWKKASFHGRMQQSVRELASYILPDLTLMDASVGLSSFHLGGPTCDPPVGRLLAGGDAYALDREAAGLLGLDWECVGHLLPL